MWAKLTGRTFASLDAAETAQEAFDALVGYARLLDADLVSYHHFSPPFARGPEEILIMSHGFPKDWVAHYREHELHLIDPITAYATYQTRPVRWSDVPGLTKLTAEQQRFMDSLYDWLSPGDGKAVPVFGPSGRHGYVGIGRRTPFSRWSGPKLRTVQAVCEAMHLRVCEILLRGLPQDFELSDRQQIILQAMADRIPDAMICGLVNLRPPALASAIERLLRTMRVSDRPSAVLRAQGLGLVD